MDKVEKKQYLSSYNFAVHLSPSGFGGDEGLTNDPQGAFAEVTGLEIQLDFAELREGGYNLGTRRLISKRSHPEIVLKRGMTTDAAFWQWVQRCTNGSYPLPYLNGTIEVFGSVNGDEDRNVSWKFFNGIATKVRAADLNASNSSAVPIEELTIVHEGLERQEV